MSTAPRQTPASRSTCAIDGMTCASCAARIEKRLNRLDGVDGDGQLRHRAGQGACAATRSTVDELVAAGRGDRLHGAPVATAGAADDARRPHDHDEPDALRDRLLVVGVLSVPVVAAGDGPGAAVRQLAVAVADAGRAGRRVGGVAVPPGGLGATCATARRRWTR